MKVKYLYEYIKNNSEIRPPMNFVFVVMGRGLFRNWKQPIYFNYDCPPTKKLILSLIDKLNEIQYSVVSITSDLGPKNKEIMNS